MKKITDKVREAIEKGNLEDALEIVSTYLNRQNTNLHNEAILHKASLNINNRNLRQSLITNDEAGRIRARINQALLSLLIDIEKENIIFEKEKVQKTNFVAQSITMSKHLSNQNSSQTLADNESRELFLVGEVFRVTAAAGHIFRPTSNSDWGIDGEIEFKNNSGEASGQRVYLQLKSGDSYLYKRKTDGNEIFTIKNSRHAEYWFNQPCPVLLVIRNSSGQIRWMNVTEYLQIHGVNTKQIIFQGHAFTADKIRQIQAEF